MRTTLKIVVNGIGVYLASLAARPAIEFQGEGVGLVLTIAIVGLLFGLFNTYVPAILHQASRPIVALTIFTGNAVLLWLVAKGTDQLADRLHLENLWPAAVGGVVATTVAIALHAWLPTHLRTKELA